MTVGVLMTPRTDGLRPWDTTMCAVFGEQEFTPEARAALEEMWPHPRKEPPPEGAHPLD